MDSERLCVVCGGKLQGQLRAKEDVVPIWLRDYLSLEDAPANPLLIGHPTGVHGYQQGEFVPFIVKRERRHPFNKMLAGNICGGCNNGWMSALENEVKPILKGLIEAPTRHDVGLTGWLTIARWMVKTAFMFEQSNRPGKELVPSAHARLLAKGEVPPGVAILLTKSAFSHPHFQWVSRDWFSCATDEIDETQLLAFTLRTYKYVTHIRELVLTLVYVPPERPWRVSIWADMHEPVLNTGLTIDRIPWTLPLPTGPEIGFLAALCVFLSPGPYAVDVRPNGRVAADGRPAPCFEHELDLIRWAENFPPLSGKGRSHR